MELEFKVRPACKLSYLRHSKFLENLLAPIPVPMEASLELVVLGIVFSVR